MSEKQKYRFNVHYKFTGQYDRVETWLHMNCASDYNVIVEQKPLNAYADGNLSIYFKRQSDLARFRDQALEGF